MKTLNKVAPALALATVALTFAACSSTPTKPANESKPETASNEGGLLVTPFSELPSYKKTDSDLVSTCTLGEKGQKPSFECS